MADITMRPIVYSHIGRNHCH